MTNELIQRIFAGFTVGDFEIPVSFLFYDGESSDYITYQMVDEGNVLAANDQIIGWVEYFDFDFFSSGNFEPMIVAAKELLEDNGFVWQPSRDSPDQYEEETKKYHKTICFAHERSR